MALGQIAPYVDLLLAQGVSGAFICGTTGEGASLTVQERKDIAKTWVDAAAGRLDIIVHTGHNCLDDAVDLGRHAASIGADAISALAPSFFKPDSDATLVACCAKMAAAAPDLPFYYYHLPSMTGTSFPVSRWMSQAGSEIPNFAGVKFTYEDIEDFARCLQLDGGRFKCFFGRDELFFQGCQAGATAAVGSTYNYAGKLYVAIDEAFRAGDFAEGERLQKISCDFIDVIGSYGFFDAAKSLMAYAGVDCGKVRLPIPLTLGNRMSEMLGRLEAVGMLDYVPRA